MDKLTKRQRALAQIKIKVFRIALAKANRKISFYYIRSQTYPLAEASGNLFTERKV